VGQISLRPSHTRRYQAELARLEKRERAARRFVAKVLGRVDANLVALAVLLHWLRWQAG
jgi:hypothetical protein